MNKDPKIVFTPADLDEAALQGLITNDQADELVRWGYRRLYENPSREPMEPRAEENKGFNLVTVAYYFGALLMIGACGWFLGDKWETLGSTGVFTTALVYVLAAASIGLWVRKQGFIVGGGLLVTVAVCLVPLLTYSLQDLLGLWPAEHPGRYAEFFPRIHASWIVMELATIGVAAIALWFIRFGFLTAPIAFSFWFFSMDVASLILQDRQLSGDRREWISVIVGIITIVIGYLLDRYMPQQPGRRSEDFAFWCYFFGTLAFWGGLTAMDGESELNRAIYALINVGLIGLAIKLRRTVFLVFGAIGVHIYLGHLAYTVFKDSFFFPFAIAFLGLSLILATVFAQRFLIRREKPEPAWDPPNATS